MQTAVKVEDLRDLNVCIKDILWDMKKHIVAFFSNTVWFES